MEEELRDPNSCALPEIRKGDDWQPVWATMAKGTNMSASRNPIRYQKATPKQRSEQDGD